MRNESILSFFVPPTSGCRFRRTPAHVAATRPQGAGAADTEGGGTNDA